MVLHQREPGMDTPRQCTAILLACMVRLLRRVTVLLRHLAMVVLHRLAVKEEDMACRHRGEAEEDLMAPMTGATKAREREAVMTGATEAVAKVVGTRIMAATDMEGIVEATVDMEVVGVMKSAAWAVAGTGTTGVVRARAAAGTGTRRAEVIT